MRDYLCSDNQTRICLSDWVPSHVNITSNEIADTLAKDGAAQPTRNSSPLIYPELHSTYINNKQSTIPPALHWYEAKRPGGSLSLQCSNQEQTIPTRFWSCHLQTLTFMDGNKVLPTCVRCSACQACPEHILDLLGLTKQDLYEDPLMMLDFLRARQKGLSAEQYSLVFGVYSLSQITFSVIVGRSLTKIGPKFIVLAGLFLTGGSTILFGCLEKSPGGPIFFWLCMAVRAVEGAGFAAYLTSSLAVIVRTFPTNPGYYVGLTETIVTVAMISGPPLGSALYTAGGYSCPFVSFGLVIIIMSIASYYLISEDKNDSNEKKNDLGSLTLKEYKGLLKLPAGAMVLVSVTCNVTADAFILIALSEHLVQFHLTPMMVGSIYLCLFLSYGLSSPLAGKIGDKMGGEFLLQSGGCLIMAISFILIGPGSFLRMQPKIVLIVVGLLLKGLGAGPLISCSYSAALKAASNFLGVRSHNGHSFYLYDARYQLSKGGNG
ncbi:MFS-type transporter SLC18B1 [Trichonephila clavipes]|nr:MFS-type transporter SLC18B1 [Trichonephila clavipes]